MHSLWRHNSELQGKDSMKYVDQDEMLKMHCVESGKWEYDPNNERVQRTVEQGKRCIHCQWQWRRKSNGRGNGNGINNEKKPSCKISNYAVTLVHIWYNIWVNLRHIAGFNFDSSALAFSNNLCGCRFFLPFPFFVCTTEHIKLNMMNENISAHILKFYIKNTNTCK